MDFIQINNAKELRDFLMTQDTNDLWVTYIKNKDGADLHGIRTVTTTLSDGSETVDFQMEWSA